MNKERRKSEREQWRVGNTERKTLIQKIIYKDERETDRYKKSTDLERETSTENSKEKIDFHRDKHRLRDRKGKRESEFERKIKREKQKEKREKDREKTGLGK